ncbi:MAG: hypothetical protein HUJ68_02190 [Clostridia bacterium]|nr:hypothetical protein [Clostridia bacterium]
MAVSMNTVKVIEYLQGINGADITANDVAEALGLSSRQVNGIFTGGIQRKGLGVREDAEIKLEDGSLKKVKFLKLTEEGAALDTSLIIQE